MKKDYKCVKACPRRCKWRFWGTRRTAGEVSGSGWNALHFSDAFNQSACKIVMDLTCNNSYRYCPYRFCIPWCLLLPSLWSRIRKATIWPDVFKCIHIKMDIICRWSFIPTKHETPCFFNRFRVYLFAIWASMCLSRPQPFYHLRFCHKKFLNKPFWWDMKNTN